jgi:hypothetical protein
MPLVHPTPSFEFSVARSVLVFIYLQPVMAATGLTIGRGLPARCPCRTCLGRGRPVTIRTIQLHLAKDRLSHVDSFPLPVLAPEPPVEEESKAPVVVAAAAEEEEFDDEILDDIPPLAAAPADPKTGAARALVLQLLEKKAIHRDSQASFVATLLIVKHVFSSHCPDVAKTIPHTWKLAMKLIRAELPTYTDIHCCPEECGHLFRDELADALLCPCGAERYHSNHESGKGPGQLAAEATAKAAESKENKGEKKQKEKPAAKLKPRLVMRHFSIIARLRARFACAAYAKLLRYPIERKADPERIRDVQDAERWRHVFGTHVPNSMYSIALNLTADGFVLDKFKKRSLTPILASVLNLPPWVRNRSGALLVLALVPERAKKVEPYLQPFIEEMSLLQSTGVPMWDGNKLHWANVHATLLYDMNDIAGAPKVSGTRSCGSIYGACYICDTLGVRVAALKTTVPFSHPPSFPPPPLPHPPNSSIVLIFHCQVYPGSHRFLHPDDGKNEEDSNLR